MSEDGLHPYETILRMCAAAAPEPWYPRLYAKQEGVDTHELGQSLEDLWLSGLVERADGGSEKGPAISLTREGQGVLLDPEALQRLRAGQPVSSADRAGILRQSLQAYGRAFVTIVLVLVNVAVFAWGYLEARQKNVDDDFLRGTAFVKARKDELNRILERSGSLSVSNWIDGQWWRLLTAGFVHLGFLHLLLNMVFLYLAGRFVEPMWGQIRYLLIYLTSILGASCLSLAHDVGNAGIISTAYQSVCGLLGAEIVWFLFNRRYLPRALMRQARRSFLIDVVLLIFIASFKNVSGWGIVGGAAAGALTALLLQLHRFGPPTWRWLAITGFVPMAWYGHYSIEQARLTNPAWKEVEAKYVVDRIYPEVNGVTKEASAVYREKVEPLLEKHPDRRDPDKVEAVLPLLSEQQHKLNASAEKLASIRPFISEEAEDARQVGRDYLQAMAEWFAGIEKMLRLAGKRTDKDRQALRGHEKKVNELRQSWKDLFE